MRLLCPFLCIKWLNSATAVQVQAHAAAGGTHLGGKKNQYIVHILRVYIYTLGWLGQIFVRTGQSSSTRRGQRGYATRRGGAAAPPAEAEAPDAAGPARRRQGTELQGSRRGRRWRPQEAGAEQGAGDRGRAAEHVTAARHGVRRVARRRPGRRRGGALRSGRQATAAAVRRPLCSSACRVWIQRKSSWSWGAGASSSAPRLQQLPPLRLLVHLQKPARPPLLGSQTHY